MHFRHIWDCDNIVDKIHTHIFRPPDGGALGVLAVPVIAIIERSGFKGET